MSSAFQRFRQWLQAKWDSAMARAEAWLPWALGVASGLILVVGLAAGFIRSHSRGPAGFVEISDSEIPADSIYATDPDEVKSGARIKIAKRSAQSSSNTGDHGGRSLIVALARTLTNEEFEARTGVLTERGRVVVIATNALQSQGVRNKPGTERLVRFDLFPDVAPNFKMRLVSDYRVNQGIHAGVAEDDPESRANLTTGDGMMSGFVVYRGKEYRIVPDAAQGVHYIIEVRK